MTYKRHVGRIANTDERCVVVFMQIPGDPDFALIAPVDTLTPRVEQALMDILESQEGQADPTLANVLGRRLFPETGKSVLQTLHEGGVLRRVSINSVMMLPQPNMPIPLRTVIEKVGGAAALSPTAVSDDTATSDTKYNPHTANAQALSDESRAGIARNLLMEADDLEAIARAKRAQAYSYAPELQPRADVEKVVQTNIEAPVKKTARKKTGKVANG